MQGSSFIKISLSIFFDDSNTYYNKEVNLSQTILEEKFLKNDCPMPMGHKAF